MADASLGFSYLGYAALVASGFFVLFGARSNQSRKALADSVLALQGRLDAKQDEMSEMATKLEAQTVLNDSLTKQTEDLRSSVRTLERVVTSADEIKALTNTVRAGFQRVEGLLANGSKP